MRIHPSMAIIHRNITFRTWTRTIMMATDHGSSSFHNALLDVNFDWPGLSKASDSSYPRKIYHAEGPGTNLRATAAATYGRWAIPSILKITTHVNHFNDEFR
jgi:hypothetical protein